MKRYHSLFSWLLFLIGVPLVLCVGKWVFPEKHYALTILLVAVLSCVPLLYSFEKKQHTTAELAVVAVMITLSAVGRCVFAWLPAFKPVTAIVVIAGVWLSKDVGFIVGALSALVSNMYFGQGPWTPFQMFAWGMIGFAAGVLSSPLRRSKWLLCLYGILAGVMFSTVMDLWSSIWQAGTFEWTRYAALMVSALPVTVTYAVSNVVFLLLAANPIGDKLDRVKQKYGLFASQ